MSGFELFRHPRELEGLQRSQIECHNKDINVPHSHNGNGNRPGRRGALKCARCRRHKRGGKVGHHSISNLMV